MPLYIALVQNTEKPSTRLYIGNKQYNTRSVNHTINFTMTTHLLTKVLHNTTLQGSAQGSIQEASSLTLKVLINQTTDFTKTALVY